MMGLRAFGSDLKPQCAGASSIAPPFARPSEDSAEALKYLGIYRQIFQCPGKQYKNAEKKQRKQYRRNYPAVRIIHIEDNRSRRVPKTFQLRIAACRHTHS